MEGRIDGSFGVFTVPAVPRDGATRAGLVALLKKRMATRPEGRDSGIEEVILTGTPSSPSSSSDIELSVWESVPIVFVADGSSSLTSIFGIVSGLLFSSTGLIIPLSLLSFLVSFFQRSFLLVLFQM